MLKITCLCGLFLFLNTKVFSQWEKLGDSNLRIYDLAVKGDQLFAGGPTQLYHSLDEGINWNTLTTFSPGYIDIIQPINEFILVGLSRGCFDFCPDLPTIFRSTDDGLTWDPVHAAQLGTTQITPFNNMIFANSDGLLIRSKDDGETWELETSIGYDIVALAGNNSALFVSKYQDSLYRSYDNGSTWQSIVNGLPNTTTWDIIAKEDTILVNAGSVYRTTDNGDTWESANNGLPETSLSGIYWEDQYLFTASFDNKVFMTTANNINWVDISDGLVVTGRANIYDLVKTDKYIFVSAENGIWRRPLSQLGTIDDSDQAFLKQNYPNPFHSITTIEYNLSKPGFTTLTIYNALGEIIEIFDEGLQIAGNYKIEFNSKDHPGGIYYYRLSQGEFSESKAMLLVK